uniref:ATP synthase subunit gamma, mitochondrial n=1 Tax=Moramonas marocensis TaxID=1805496 RepID=A0A140F2I6_9EUKA|nr:ATP synthase F1 subunit gamma [Moramonas marocensis]
MASTKDFKVRIKSITSIKKITKAMKMVAASKLRQVQRNLDIIRPSFESINSVYNEYLSTTSTQTPPSTGHSQNHFILAISSDRGLCGGINTNTVKATKNSMRNILSSNSDNQVRLFTIGEKGKEVLAREHSKLLSTSVSELSKKTITFVSASLVAEELFQMKVGDTNVSFDFCHIIYSKFKSVISQVLVEETVLSTTQLNNYFYEFNQYELDSEENKSELLYDFYEFYLGLKLFSSLLENATSEQGARMNAMDSASRNAGEMIDKLTLIYNKARQASITRELIEIISCASAVSSSK